jgi:uncharacterized membrane protein YciS (DUF1049 family)
MGNGTMLATGRYVMSAILALNFAWGVQLGAQLLRTARESGVGEL